MISTQDFLNISLAIGFLILVGFVSFAFYNLALTLRTIRETIIEIRIMKEGMKISLLSIANTLLGRR